MACGRSLAGWRVAGNLLVAMALVWVSGCGGGDPDPLPAGGEVPMKEAKSSNRVGANPLVVKAVSSKGKSDVIISDSDAAKLREGGVNFKFLSEARVILVVD